MRIDPKREALEGLVGRYRPIMRWVVAPCTLLFSAIMVLSASDATELIPRILRGAAAVAFALLAVGAWHPVRHRWALRAFAGAVAVSCAWYLVVELLDASSTTSVLPKGRADTHPLNAILAALAFGVPAASFALTGSFRWWIRDASELGEPGLDQVSMHAREQMAEIPGRDDATAEGSPPRQL